jgi:peptide/nickel transport system permease protein/oligopeptide transport system permease protein
MLQAIPVFFGATFLIFAMVFAIPGDPIRALAGEQPLAERTVQAMRDRYNLDDPLPVQYGKYMLNIAQGDFGETFNGRPVADIMRQRFPITLRLAVVAFVFEFVIGLTAGVVAGIKRRSWLDSGVLLLTTLIVAVPVFVFGFVAQLVFGVQLGLLPIAGIRDGWLSYILPGLVLGSVSLAYIARLTRTSLIENLRADYVRTARAKGLSARRVVGRHALRNSLIPVVTFLGLDVGLMMSGAIVTEGIFNIPGVGGEVFRAITAQEGPVVVGIVTALVLIFILVNLVVDLLYAVLDPRIRYD